MEYKSFDLLNKLYFVRTSGSKEELEAANIIAEEAKKLKADNVEIEEFDVDGVSIHKASLVFGEPNIEVECEGVGLSGSTEDNGVTGEFIYVPSLEDAKCQDVTDKICMIHGKMPPYKIYQYLVKNKARGIITTTGNIYKDNEDVDLDPYNLRDRHKAEGIVPTVCIRLKDAENIIRKMPHTATIVLKQDNYINKSHNVVATINGTTKAKEVVCFSAHYDSVSFSKGAYDNATGSTGIMQILAYFVKNRPSRTLKFIWCGSEEIGLMGSKDYVAKHKEELENYRLNINIDMIGVTLGNDIARVTAETGLVDYIKYDALINGFAINVRQGVYSSDSTPFADNLVPAISFARISTPGGASIHSHDDVMDYLSEDNYYKTCDYIINFANTLVNSKVFPVNKEMPDNMKLELDYYLARKERPE